MVFIPTLIHKTASIINNAKKTKRTMMPIRNGISPVVVEKSIGGDRAWDLQSRLLKDRIIFLGEEIDDMSAQMIVMQMLFLETDNKEDDIHLYIMSPGGSVYAGMAIYDTMQMINPCVHTYCVGMAASMGAFLLAAGEKGHRYALESSTIMIHQPWGGANGDATNIEIQAQEINRLKKYLTAKLAKHCGKTEKQITIDTERDNYMSAQDALKYGLVDEIIG